MTYEAVATKDGRYWSVEIQGLPENYAGYTQGRTWTEAEEMTRDAIANLLEVSEESVAVRLVPADEEARGALDTLERARTVAAEAERAEAEALRKAAETLTTHGFSVRDAGAALGISYQRVSQLSPRQAA